MITTVHVRGIDLADGDRVRGLVLTIPPTAWDTRRDQAHLYEAMAQMAHDGGVEPLIKASAGMAPPHPTRSPRSTTTTNCEPRRCEAPIRSAWRRRFSGRATPT